MGYISLTGNPITFTANRVNTISSLVLNGKTTQSGTGDPSPTNIRPIYGVGQYDKKVNTSDILASSDKTYGGKYRVYFSGLTDVLPSPDGQVGLIIADKCKTVPFTTLYGVGQPNEVCVAISSRGVISILVPDASSTSEALAWIKANPITVYYQSTSYSTATQVYCGFSVTDANGYHGYAAGPTAPLYDGDTLDFVTGEVVRNNRQLLLAIKDMNNLENYPGWKDLSVLKDDYPNKQGSFYEQGIWCVSNIDKSGLSVWLNTNGTQRVLYLRVFGLTQTQWKEQYPDLVFQIVYQLATPTTETVPISEPITNAAGTVTLSAENTMNVTYFQLEVSNNKYQDIQITDNTLLTQLQQAWSNGDYTTAFNIIDNNSQLDTKSFIADVINTLTANLIYLQNLNDPTFKADRIQTSATPPVDLQVGQVYFKTL